MPNIPDKELREKLAAIEHERWSDWQKWCHEVIRQNNHSPETEDVLQRWDKQIATPYSELSDEEKASDMEQVDRYWPLIEAYTANKQQEILDWVEQEVVGADELVRNGQIDLMFQYRNELRDEQRQTITTKRKEL